ncbi:hypothetical protein PAN31117_00657 [Pandoraea anapnoica]|uniref:DUF4440 domain-containing protein n=1 Tax=Pandoraea anapnoica TaxID=2508301 RepID=A0A5E4ZLU4_9BURK|nr:DUF4440 domain-containing protein [Pandoraea anapnoica]VVE61838.1 hypothetical protein PAN31117_00657 [Pandoraea anapnoica]
MSNHRPQCSSALAQEVIDAHIAIEQWLSGRAEPTALESLLARFSPAFSMIALPGTRVNRAALDTLFGQGHGKRPGLQIVVDEVDTLAESPTGGVVVYRETQTDGEGHTSVRRSTAVFERETDGHIVWRHLHETPVIAN